MIVLAAALWHKLSPPRPRTNHHPTTHQPQHVKFEFPVGKIIYTHTDEAPALATYSFLPIIEAFVNSSEVMVEKRDISVAGRIIAAFPDYLEKKQVSVGECWCSRALVAKPTAP